jgi:hypothetical protein
MPKDPIPTTSHWHEPTAEPVPPHIKAALDAIYNEVLELHHHRQIWRFFNDELPKRNGGIVHAALTRWYVDAQAAAIRRIAGIRSQDKRSLARLLEKVRQERLLQAKGVTVEVIQRDLASLKSETAIITRWADESVAHMGRTPSTNPTFGHLDKAIDHLGEMLQKYYVLLTGSYLAAVEPVIQDDWRAPFRAKWL